MHVRAPPEAGPLRPGAEGARAKAEPRICGAGSDRSRRPPRTGSNLCSTPPARCSASTPVFRAAATAPSCASAGRLRATSAAASSALRPPSRCPTGCSRSTTNCARSSPRSRPSALAVERVLFQANVRTAMSVGQASGLALVVAARAGVPVAQYSPNEVKLAVTGDGRADKLAVQTMVTRLLGLREIPKPPDAADALALACCHHGRAPHARRRIPS